MRPNLLTDLCTLWLTQAYSMYFIVVKHVPVHPHTRNDTHQYTPYCTYTPYLKPPHIKSRTVCYHAIYDSQMATGCLWLAMCSARTIPRNVPTAMHARVFQVERSIGNTVAFPRTVHVCPEERWGCSQWNALVCPVERSRRSDLRRSLVSAMWPDYLHRSKGIRVYSQRPNGVVKAVFSILLPSIATW